MKDVATTRMSSRGQVVIPEDIRKRLGLTTGSQFIVIGEDDVVIMKTITRPSMRDFDSLTKNARKQARDAGMTRSDISHTIAEVRGKK
ncbi:MAG: AbrB/MazE/SpoVT family DNA-binding domain-containing protein [bacterium]|nr:AbrB/MazE/SpoVT family DNA-binding domain-containing protein [bacterium]